MTSLFATTDFELPPRNDFPDCHPKGRVCPVDDCGTILTIWNPGPMCFRCTADHESIVRQVADRLSGDARRMTLAHKRQRDAAMRELVAEGRSKHEVATMFGVSRQRMSQILGGAKAAA